VNAVRKGSKVLLLFAGLAFTVAKGSRTEAVQTAPDDNKATNPRITLRVYNYARVPSPILVHAKHEASNIFRRAGVETTWLDCRLSVADAPTPACDRPFGPADLILRLLSSSMARRLATKGDVCGVALGIKDPPATYAYIFYGCVLDLANRGYIVEGGILAAVMAHEVGHLLLGPGHSPSGIMRAKWTREDLAIIQVGFLLFTPHQSVLIRSEILARIGSQ
jgi:hypothetical protein